MKLILLGAPGAGKGTQAEVICEKYHIPTISTGNIIREALKNATELGIKAKIYMDSGELVPDDIVIAIVQERLMQSDCQAGFILDGFPRTVPQAEALDKMGAAIGKVISLEVADDEIMKRLSGRRVCESCGASYHMAFKPPKQDGVCDKCGKKLVIRKDDAPETIAQRLKVYHDQTEPLKAYYQKTGKLCTVIGHDDLAVTTKRTLQALEGNE